MSIGQKIKRERERQGLSQPRLASLCGWESQSRISQYESGAREPGLADLRRIVRALGKDMNWLFREEDGHDTHEPTARELLRAIGQASEQQIEQILAILTEEGETVWPQSKTEEEPQEMGEGLDIRRHRSGPGRAGRPKKPTADKK